MPRPWSVDLSLPPFFPLCSNCGLDHFPGLRLVGSKPPLYPLSCLVVMCLRHGVMASAVPEFPCYRCAAISDELSHARLLSNCATRPFKYSSSGGTKVSVSRAHTGVARYALATILKHCDCSDRRFPVISTSGSVILWKAVAPNGIAKRITFVYTSGLWQGRDPKTQRLVWSARDVAFPVSVGRCAFQPTILPGTE